MEVWIKSRPPGEMASRLTTNQEIAGSTPAVVNLFYFWLYYLLISAVHQPARVPCQNFEPNVDFINWNLGLSMGAWVGYLWPSEQAQEHLNWPRNEGHESPQRGYGSHHAQPYWKIAWIETDMVRWLGQGVFKNFISTVNVMLDDYHPSAGCCSEFSQV